MPGRPSPHLPPGEPRLRRSAGALALAAGLFAACGSDASDADGPNVVVVVIDTLRADRLPFYGYEKDTAPFLTSLAERGVVFERAWSTSSWTAPSTASIFTGLYPFQHGVEQGIKLTKSVQQSKDPGLELNRIPERLETLPEAMRRLGYETFGVTDNPNICREEGFEDGFVRFANFDYRGGDVVNRALGEWLEEIRSSKKWFVYLHYMDPHFPYHRREPWFEAPAGPFVPENRLRTVPRERTRAWIDAAYDSEIRFCDERIREAFAALGVDQETVVVVVADHGEELMQRSDALQHDFKLYSELTHVPLLVVDPRNEPRRARVAANVSIVDVLPTVLGVLGEPADHFGEAGRSLVPHYAGADAPADDRPVFSMRSQLETQGAGELRSVVRGGDKLIHGWRRTSDEAASELYDIEVDWPELEDLHPTEGERVGAELDAIWRAFEGSAPRWSGQRVRIDFTEDEANRIGEIGYGGSDD